MVKNIEIDGVGPIQAITITDDGLLITLTRSEPTLLLNHQQVHQLIEALQPDFAPVEDACARFVLDTFWELTAPTLLRALENMLSGNPPFRVEAAEPSLTTPAKGAPKQPEV